MLGIFGDLRLWGIMLIVIVAAIAASVAYRIYLGDTPPRDLDGPELSPEGDAAHLAAAEARLREIQRQRD